MSSKLTENNLASSIVVEVPWEWMQGEWRGDKTWRIADNCPYNQLIAELSSIKGVQHIQQAEYTSDTYKKYFNDVSLAPRDGIIRVFAGPGVSVEGIQKEVIFVTEQILMAAKSAEADYNEGKKQEGLRFVQEHFANSCVVSSSSDFSWYRARNVRVSLVDENGVFREEGRVDYRPYGFDGVKDVCCSRA